jgi:hypothetical protein
MEFIELYRFTWVNKNDLPLRSERAVRSAIPEGVLSIESAPHLYLEDENIFSKIGLHD